MSGARIVLECLKREGVDVVFGLPGGAVLPIYDALYDFQGLRHILVRQEAAAGHAAEGYARTTGKVGVCLVTSGPAATNLVTALQDAYMDSIPIVAFTGQVPTHLIGNDAFQEADNVGITRSCTKHNFLVKDGKDLGPIIREAFHIASTGRPGPVHVDLPKDILVKEWELVWPEKIQLRSFNPTYDGHPGQIKRAAKLPVRARKPVLHALIAAVRDELPDDGPSEAREARKQWLAEIAEWKARHPLRYEWDDELIKPQYVMQEISNLTRGEAMVVTGVGQHQMWAAQYYKFKHPRRWCTSGGLGTMGYGLPTAMGVAAAHPDRLVVNVDGDGSFVMNSQELATCHDNNLAVKTIIINNGGHGMVRQWQGIIYKGRFCAIDFGPSPDFVKLAEAYGCVGIRASKPSEVVPALEKAFATPGPVVVDVVVDKWEYVFPMVPAGGANLDMILESPTVAAKDKAAKSQTGF